MEVREPFLMFRSATYLDTILFYKCEAGGCSEGTDRQLCLFNLSRRPMLQIVRLHHSVSINPEDLSVNPFTILRCQEADNTGNINRQTNTAERRPRGSVL